MSERRAWWPFGKNVVAEEKIPIRMPSNQKFNSVAGIPDLVRDTEKLRSDSKYDSEFDLFDNMLKLDPELNGAVRAVSLTGNNYEVNYTKGKNATIRNAIKTLVEETLDFDDFLINAMRGLMVYGNDINKIVGKQGVGITDLQSLPVKQMTIVDERGELGSIFNADQDNPITRALYYILREMKLGVKKFNANEIMHIKIDARSNWFVDNKGRTTYGIWGASRFTSLKQPIRMKYNTMNNRISLEDAMTKQYITISKDAIEHITDPAEQSDRLNHIMNEVIGLFEGLRGDQIPVLPHYVELHHVNLENALPNSSDFLDSVNGDIAAVLQVPRVASGQEKGSTFAATFNANMWAVQAISRMHRICHDSCSKLFSLHLNLLNIPHTMQDLPQIEFDTMDTETPLNTMQRVTMGYTNGLITLNQSLEMLNLPLIGAEGEKRLDMNSPSEVGEVPRENTQPGATDIVDAE
tara:strand:- start:103 stop:1497 length:1395 start_codon:yes stop_codon:yes gene_type:complete